MKKTLSLLIAVVLVLGMMGMSVSANRGLTYTANYATPVIDGQVDEAWSVAEWTNVDLLYDGVTETVCSVRVKILHDDQYLYYLAEATDATLGAGDCVEFYVDEDNCKMEGAYCDVSTQLCINLPDGNPTKNASSASMSEADAVVAYGSSKSDNGYIFEWAFAPINGMPADGSVMGIEFMYNDCDESGTFINALRWNVDTAAGDVAPWQEVASFGELTLAAKPVVEEAPVEDVVVDAGAAEATPVTADAGVVVAAVVMAAAAAVVLSKKH